MTPTKIAIVGARGIANYGGYETVVGELAPRLHALGFDVYCSHRLQTEGERVDKFKGVNLVYFPLRFPQGSILGRVFDLFYDWYFTVKCAFSIRCEVVYCLGLGAGLSLSVAGLSKASILVNVDGLEWTREKFSYAERAYLRVSFLASCIWADRIVIDNESLFDYIPSEYRSKTVHIPYGVLPLECPKWDPEIVESLVKDEGCTLVPGEYLLVVARLEPENNVHTIVEAYSRSQTDKPLVIVGSYSSRSYEATINTALEKLPRDKKVLLIGSVYNREALSMLRCFCIAYIHGHSVGGTNPSLLEAMAAGNVVMAHDNVFNREVCGNAAFYFKSVEDLAIHLDDLEKGKIEVEDYRQSVLSASKEKYGWDSVVSKYDQLLKSL